MSREPFADNTYHRSDHSRCPYSVATMYVCEMKTRDCFGSAIMHIYTRCKMDHVGDASCDMQCENTCYKVEKLRMENTWICISRHAS